MLKSSLLEIIRTFSKQELIKFEDFVRSPYFNKKENVLKLFLEINKFAPAFSDEKLEKEKIWINLYPGKEYNYGILKNNIHDLTKLCEYFITAEYTKPDILRNNNDLLAALFSRQLSRIFSSKADLMEKSYIKSNFRNEPFKMAEYYDSLRKLYFLKSMCHRLYFPGTSSFEPICHSGEKFIYSVIISYYKYYNNYLALNDKKIEEKDSITEKFLLSLNNFVSDMLDKIKAKSGKDYSILKCFHNMNLSFHPDAEISAYFNFKKSLQDCSDILPRGDLQDLLSCLSNSIERFREGKTNTGIDSVRENFDIYNMEISNNVYLFSNGVMDQNHYISYINIAFTLREYESIENLSKKYLNKIPEDRRENVRLYTLAHICFGKKDHNKSLEYLAKINHDFFNMKHLIKDIQMMNYYELNDYISFNYAMDSYKHFVSKNKSVRSHNKSLSEVFCSNINRLFKIRESYDQFELEKFRKEIRENKLINKYWILDKISELEKLKGKS